MSIIIKLINIRKPFLFIKLCIQQHNVLNTVSSLKFVLLSVKILLYLLKLRSTLAV